MFDVNVDEELELTILKGQGLITVDEIKETIGKIFLGDVTPFMMWDFSEADVSALGQQEIRVLALFARDAIHSQTEGKTALIGSTAEDLEKGDFYAVFTEFSDHFAETKAFLNREEAFAWFKQP